jgi:hypothetical protein
MSTRLLHTVIETNPGGGTMKRLAVFVLSALALTVAGAAGASTTQTFHATFHDVSFQSTCSPPIVFCGSGAIADYGRATTVVRVTRNVPIPGTACNDVAGIRTMTLDDGSGTFVSTFTGERCPLGNGGHAFRVDFDWEANPSASTGAFAGATGTGTGVNTTAGNVQVVTLTGTITL